MESSEDDAGASRDAPRHSLARENACERSSGEVDDDTSRRGPTAEAAKERPPLGDGDAGGGSADSPTGGSERPNPTIDDESQHSTEAILQMIDKFVEGSSASKKARYNVERFDSAGARDSIESNPLKSSPESSAPSAKSHMNNCYAPGSSAEDGRTFVGRTDADDVDANRTIATDSGRKLFATSAPISDRVSPELEDMVNIVSSTDRSAVIVPVKNNTKVISEPDIISSSEQSEECPQSSSVHRVGDPQLCERTSSERSTTPKAEEPAAPATKSLENCESSNSNNPASLSSADSLSDLSKKTESPDSCSKPENSVVQRRKLVRPASVVTKPSESTVSKGAPASKTVEVRSAVDATSLSVVSTPQSSHDSVFTVTINDQIAANKLTSNEDTSDNPPSANVSPKKVKLVRHLNMKMLEANAPCSLQSKIVTLQGGDSAKCSPSSLDDGNIVPTSKTLCPHLTIDKKQEDSDESFQEHFTATSVIADSCSMDVDEIITSKDAGQCLIVNKVDSIHISKTLHSAKSRDEPVPKLNENTHWFESESDHNSVSLPNNLCDAEVDQNISADKSNEVLDVRKVSPLKLNLSYLDDSVALTVKKNATNQKIHSPGDDETGDTTKNVPKLTLKLSNIHSDDIKLTGKSPKLNIKPLRAPESDSHRHIKNQATTESVGEVETSKIPNVVKLNIKPIQRPSESKSSSSSEISESDSSENETLPTGSLSAANEARERSPQDRSCPPIPKLTIKSLSTTPKVDCDSLELKVSKVTVFKASSSPDFQVDSPSPAVPKLTFKPLVQPPIEKMTIKINKSHDFNYENKCEIENTAHQESIPKLTLKRGKSQESILNSEPNDVQEDKIESSLKMTIKLGKPLETASENKIDSTIDSLHIPKASKRNSQKVEPSNSEPIPKLTIKIPQDHESRNSERIDSPSIPKLTIKPIVKPEDHPPVPKLTIKPVVKPSEDVFSISENDIDSTSALKLTIKTKPLNIKLDESASVPKINIKPLLKPIEDAGVISYSEDEGDCLVKHKNNAKRGIESHDSPTVPKLTIKAIPVPENMDKPLEIVTASGRSTPGHQESGQDSPRIILKINKTVQGSTSEIITEKSQKKTDSDRGRVDCESADAVDPLVPKLTIKIPQEQNMESLKLDNARDAIENESNSNSPLGRIKLKLTKEGNRAEIVNAEIDDVNEISKENVLQVSKSAVKRPAPKDEVPLLLKKVTDTDKTVTDSKRMKLDQLLTNSNLTVTRIPKAKIAGNADGASDTMPNVSISVLSLGSREEKITSDFNKTNSKRTSPILPKSNTSFSNNGESKLQDILSRLQMQKEDRSAVSPVSSFPFAQDVAVLAEADSNTTSTTASSEGTVSEPVNPLGADSPIFNKVDGDMMALNEGSSSQECMMLDDLSQDPLDIGSTAKSHFVPLVSEAAALSDIKNSIVNIMAQGNTNAVTVSPFIATPRKRGRPRKSAIIDTPVRVTDSAATADERPVRSSRTPRDRPAILRTPRSRGRGRGRGSRRALASGIGIGRGLENDSPLHAAHAFFLNLPPPHSQSATGISSLSLECQVKLPRLGADCVQPVNASESSDRCLFLEGDRREGLEGPVPNVIPTTGRGRGRGSRGPRRSRGGRGSRGPRGGRGSRGARSTRAFPDSAEEMIQLQDPVAISEIRRDGRKSKLEITRTPALQVFEEETCMIGDIGTPNRLVSLLDEESQSSVLSGQTTESGKYKRSRLMDMLDEGHKEWTPADVAEYDWPSEPVAGESPQTVMIQEQVALYLGVKSFKRRYPDLKRRALGADEKNHVRDRGLVSEALCDLGVTAVDAGEVLDIMYTDFPSKYEEYRKHLRENRDARPVQSVKPPPPAHLAPLPGTDRSKQESMEKACESAAEWNAQLNRQRKTARSAAVDLQTFTLHRPRRPPTLPPPSSQLQQTVSHYPVALLPGQYTDYYRTYTPEELTYFPLSSVLRILPPVVPTKEESSSEESGDDSDSVDSSGDESGSETSEKNFKRKSNAPSKARSRAHASGAELSVPSSRPASPQSKDLKENVSNPSSPLPAAPSLAPAAAAAPSDVMRCKLCSGTEHCNRRYPTETFVTCATCHKKIHPSCLDMAPNVAKCVRLYAWQCADCKCCAHCQDLADDDKMLFCDLCDRGYHIYCVGLRKVPTGRWHCSHCAVCRSCNARHPSGQPESAGSHPPPLGPAPPDQWHHHLKKTSAGQKRYSHTLCAPCARAWRAGRYCSVCERCFMGRKGAMRLVICTHCDRRFHQECVKQQGKQLDVLDYTCNACRRGGATRAQNKRGGGGWHRGGGRRPAKPPPSPPHLLRDGSDRSNTNNADSDRSVAAADHFADSSFADDRTEPDADHTVCREPPSSPGEDDSLRRFSSADPLRRPGGVSLLAVPIDVPADPNLHLAEDIEMDEPPGIAADPLRDAGDDVPLSAAVGRLDAVEEMNIDFVDGGPTEDDQSPAPPAEEAGGGADATSDPLANDADAVRDPLAGEET